MILGILNIKSLFCPRTLAFVISMVPALIATDEERIDAEVLRTIAQNVSKQILESVFAY